MMNISEKIDKTFYFIKRSNKEVKLAIIIFLFVPVLIGLLPRFYTWFSIDNHGVWMKGLFLLLDRLTWVNIPIIIILGYITYLIGCKLIMDKEVRLYRFSVVLVALTILWKDSQVDYARIIGSIDFRHFFTTQLSLVAILELGKLFLVLLKKRKRSSENKSSTSIFTIDNIEDTKVSKDLDGYAKDIVDRLLATNIHKESFAIGISGGWGVGKTTFLNLLRSKLAASADVVVFNPWMCQSPEQVTRDFFASLQHQLASKYSSLSKPIKDYAKYITNVTLPLSNILNLDFSFFSRNVSLYKKKQILSKNFGNLPRPIVVVIDDIDRLERDEIFEVLRLIRNTADLKNTIYLVAYDKEYVTAVLEENKIKEAYSYLEKIFPLEIHLPKVEDISIWETLFKDIVAQDNTDKNFSYNLFIHFDDDDKRLILYVLNTYRRAKRFARLYMLNFCYQNKLYPGEIKILDSFWLELLQVYDKKVYDKLAAQPECLLYVDRDKYILREGIKKSVSSADANKYIGKPFWKEDTPLILDRLFGIYRTPIAQSICWLDNYEKYFTQSIPVDKLSINDFKEIFTDNSDLEAIIQKWLNSRKSFSSISFRFKRVDVTKLNDDKLEVLIKSILWFGLKITPYNTVSQFEVCKMLYRSRYNEEQQECFHRVVQTWFDNLKGDERWLTHVGMFLNYLYAAKTFNGTLGFSESNELIISNIQIEKLLLEIMQKYLDNHSVLSALDLMDENHILFLVFKNCSVKTENEMVSREDCVYKQIAFDLIISHFAEKEIKPSLNDFNTSFKKMFFKPIQSYEDPMDMYYAEQEIAEKYRQNMNRYWGTDYQSKLNEFKEKCFSE